MKKINIGCGLDIKEGWINLDSHNTHGANLIFNLDRIINGEKLPFGDSSFDYVYCSHVIEDFIEPIKLITEFTRICKVGGIIELKTPFETNNNLTNIYHKTLFTLSKFRSLTKGWGGENYGNNYGLKIKELHSYADNGANPIFQTTKKIIAFCYNKLPISLVERTFIKYLFCVLNCRVVFEKTDVIKKASLEDKDE